MSESVEERLRRSLARLEEQTAGPAEDRVRRILAERAAATAASREEIREPDARLVVFRAASDLFGVPVESVSAITIIRSMTPLPGIPGALAGLLNVRGRHITAVDLGLFLHSKTSPSRRLGDAGKAVTVRWEEREIAFVCEELVGIREVFPGDLRELKGAAPAVRQVAADGMQVIDLAAVFADARLAARSATSSAG